MKLTDCRQLATAADELYHASSYSNSNAVTKSTFSDRKWTKKKNGYCFFHDRFGEKSYRCQPPCSFKKPGNDKADRQ